MMRLSCTEREVPPDGHFFVFPDGTRIQEFFRPDWYNRIFAHYTQNNLPIPADWKEQAEDQLCKRLPPGWCKHVSGDYDGEPINTRIGVADLLRGMTVLAQIAADPDPFVTQEEAEERGKACAGCFANENVPGCLPCIGFSNMIGNLIGQHETKSDPFLKSCLVCKCANRAQIWVKDRLLAKGITPQMHGQFKSVGEHCWKGKIEPA